MAFKKKNNDINTNDVNDFINNNKDATINVNNKCNTSVTNLIGRKAIFETNFTRQTYYIHNDLILKINQITANAPRGEKTKIINAALEQYLNAQN